MLAEQILNRITDAFDVAEVYVEQSSSKEFTLKNSRDLSRSAKIQKGCSIRAIQNNRLLFGYISFSDEPDIDRLVESLRRSLVIAPVAEADPIPEADAVSVRSPAGDLDEKRANRIVRSLDAYAHDFDSKIKDVKSATVSFYKEEFEIANTRGARVKDGVVDYAISVEVLASDNGQSDAGYYVQDADNLDALDTKFVATNAANMAVNKLHAGSISTKKYSVILENRVAQELLSAYFGAFDAYSVLNHTTPLEGRTGERIFSENVTIVDAARIPGRAATIADYEGTPRSDVLVVENGVLKSYLSDTYSSRRLGVSNTANARRASWMSLPRVGAFNFHIKPSQSLSRDQLLNRIDGLYITEIMGLHMANTISGDFSFGIEGYLIHNGEPVSYFKKATFADNFYSMMKRVIAISSNIYYFGSFGAPDIAIADCTIGGE